MRKFQLYSEYPMLNKNVDFNINEVIIDRESVVVDTREAELLRSPQHKKTSIKLQWLQGYQNRKEPLPLSRRWGQRLENDAEEKLTTPDQARIERKLKELSCKSDNGIGVAHLIVEGEKTLL